MMWGNGYDLSVWMWLAMGTATLAFWIVIVLAIRALLPAPGTTSRNRRPDPLTVLKEGVARGDMTPEEYEQRRRLIVDGH